MLSAGRPRSAGASSPPSSWTPFARIGRSTIARGWRGSRSARRLPGRGAAEPRSSVLVSGPPETSEIGSVGSQVRAWAVAEWRAFTLRARTGEAPERHHDINRELAMTLTGSLVLFVAVGSDLALLARQSEALVAAYRR